MNDVIDHMIRARKLLTEACYHKKIYFSYCRFQKYMIALIPRHCTKNPILGVLAHGLLHPKSKSFTYVSKSLNLKSRIDYFLIWRSLSCDVKQVEIRISVAPDHNAIFLSIDVKNDFNRGPGLWKFNNTLLEDNNYKELIIFYYPQILRNYYPTSLCRVQITPKTSTNITWNLYSRGSVR